MNVFLHVSGANNVCSLFFPGGDCQNQLKWARTNNTCQKWQAKQKFAARKLEADAAEIEKACEYAANTLLATQVGGRRK